MKRSLLVLFAAALSLATAGGQSSPDVRRRPETVTGCLVRGTQPKEYYIAPDGAQRSEVASDEDLSSHENKQVRVTGTRESIQGRVVLKIETIEDVRDSCL